MPQVKLLGAGAEGLIVERLPEGPSLKDFLMYPERTKLGQRQRMISDLIQFARASAAFTYIGDFKLEQLRHVKGRGWILMDWAEGHQRYDPQGIGANTVFSMALRADSTELDGIDDTRRTWIEELNKKIEAAVNLERKRWFPSHRGGGQSGLPNPRCNLKLESIEF